MADDSLMRKRTREGDDRPATRKRKNASEPEFVDDYFQVEESQNGEIKVMTSSGKIISLEVKGSDSIGKIKVKIQAAEHIPFDKQELVFNEMVLEDINTLANLRIKKNTTLTLVPKSRGFITIFIKAITYNYLAQFKPSDTIKTVKDKICCTHYALVFDGIVLEDSCTLADLHIVEGSVLTAIHESEVTMEIFVNTFTGKTLSLLYNPKDTIGDVKLAIWRKEGIVVDEQALIFNGDVLEDSSSTLADFKIVNRSVLTCIGKAERRMEIFVNSFTGKKISLLVNPGDTITNVKLAISRKERIDVDEQVLIFNNVVLGDRGTLYDFYINKNSTLTLMRKSRARGFMCIFININTPVEKCITLQVKPSDTIRDVKAKIQDEIHVPHDEQELIFNETVLHNIDTLADYNIQRESVLMLMRVSSGFMNIFIKSLGEKAIPLEVKPSNTLHNLKCKIFDMHGVPPFNQRLILNGRQLGEEALTLADHHLHDGSTLHLCVRLGGKLNEGVRLVSKCGFVFM